MRDGLFLQSANPRQINRDSATDTVRGWALTPIPSTTCMNEQKNLNRIEIIDGLRGFSVVLMVAHHLLYNLVAFLDAPSWFFFNPVFSVLAPFFAGLFIFLSGVSSRFSRSNINRGLKCLALSAVITAVTYFIGMPIWFGVLHLLGFCMLFYGLTRKFWDKIPRSAAPCLFIALIVGGAIATRNIAIRNVLAWVLGLAPRGRDFIFSYDYFPLLPWMFVFLLGTWAGWYVKERKLPERFYEAKFWIFPHVGRKALLIYMLHQPILYGLIIGILFLLR